MGIPNFSNQLFIKGFQVEVLPPNTTKTVEISFPYYTKIIGTDLFVSDCVFGDYGELVVTDDQTPANQIGSFGETVYLPSGEREISVVIQGADGSTIPPNFVYKFTLTAVDINGRSVIVWLRLKR